MFTPRALANLGLSALAERGLVTRETFTSVAEARLTLSGLVEEARRFSVREASKLKNIFGTVALSSPFAYNQVVDSDIYVETYLATHAHLQKHPAAIALSKILSDTSPPDADNFAQITLDRFEKYRDQVPHLFTDGLSVLQWLEQAREVVKQSTLKLDRIRAVEAAIDVIRTQVYSAAVTAPPNLWLARQILSTHKKLGIVDKLLSGEEIVVERFARERGLDAKQLGIDLEFLYHLGYIDQTPTGYTRHFPHSPYYEAYRTLENITVLRDFSHQDMVDVLTKAFSAESTDPEILLWLHFNKHSQDVRGWGADVRQMEIAYRLVPTVLALKAAHKIDSLKVGADNFLKTLPRDLQTALLNLFEASGFTKGGKLTELGARAFERGPGVYGIIEAYHPYLNRHEELLKNSGERPHVERGRNIVASQAANTKSFEDAVSLVRKQARKFSFVAEHACGMANGLKTWVKNIGSDNFRFVATDYEQKSVDAAQAEVAAGRLPDGTFVGKADISKPQEFIDHLLAQGYNPKQHRAVMIVGNGFHEVRGDDDARMIAILRAYREMNISIVFSEESALSSEQILRAAWSTYHACFLWCHNTSGQRIRSPWPYAESMPRLSWKDVFEAAGYRLIATKGTRRTVPCDLPKEQNPNISVTFFCVPNGDTSFL